MCTFQTMAITRSVWWCNHVLQDPTVLLVVHPPNLVACPVLWEPTALLVQPLVKYALQGRTVVLLVQPLVRSVLRDPPLSPPVQRLVSLVLYVHRVIGVPLLFLLAPPVLGAHTTLQLAPPHLRLAFPVLLVHTTPIVAQHQFHHVNHVLLVPTTPSLPLPLVLRVLVAFTVRQQAPQSVCNVAPERTVLALLRRANHALLVPTTPTLVPPRHPLVLRVLVAFTVLQQAPQSVCRVVLERTVLVLPRHANHALLVPTTPIVPPHHHPLVLRVLVAFTVRQQAPQSVSRVVLERTVLPLLPLANRVRMVPTTPIVPPRLVKPVSLDTLAVWGLRLAP